MSISKKKEAVKWIGHVFRSSAGNNKKNTYIPIKLLGIGAYASVWICYSKDNRCFVAVKIFYNNNSKSGMKEIATYDKIHKLNIRNTLRIVDNFDYTHEDKINKCIVIDLMIGSLFDVMKYGGYQGKRYNNKGFDIDVVIKILYKVLEFLSDMHSNNLVHGDIKPENILLSATTDSQKTLLCKLKNKESIKKICDVINKDRHSIAGEFEVSDESDSDNESGSDVSDESYDFDSRGGSDESEGLMSCDIERIDSLLTDDEADTSKANDDYDGLEVTDEIDVINPKYKLEILPSYINNPHIAMSDMGSCVDLADTDKPKSIQTKYYKAPEILLGLDYDMSCDIWALGCTTFELLTGSILFDPDDYETDHKRCIMQLIYKLIGTAPDEMISMSCLKDVYFTHDMTLKNNITKKPLNSDIWHKLLNKLGNTDKAYLMVDLILSMLKVNPVDRITAKRALQHQLFNK